MGAFFVYILKASVYLAILYLFYSILLSKETFYRYNRTALLLLIPLSFILPLYPVHTAVPETYSNTTILDRLPAISYIENESQSKIPIGIIAVLSIYLIGILYFITRYVCTIIKLLRLIRSGENIPTATDFLLSLSPNPCSFQLVRENSHFKSRLPKPSPRNTPTRICTHSQTSFMGFTGCRSLYRITMVQSGRLVTETRTANRT